MASMIGMGIGALEMPSFGMGAMGMPMASPMGGMGSPFGMDSGLGMMGGAGMNPMMMTFLLQMMEQMMMMLMMEEMSQGGGYGPYGGYGQMGAGGSGGAGGAVADTPGTTGGVNGPAVGTIPPDSLDGSHGGQCVVFVENQVGHHFPVGAAKQMLDPGKHNGYDVTGQAQPGEIFVMKSGQYGHTGIVKSVNKDGTVNVIDSNWGLDEKVHSHKIRMNEIAGYLKKQGG